ncbi:TIGR00153 family protein [Alkalilimnicola ehrlichii]|uniref:TIGR00153 family protein n=1 Tax=Alkalilimnicola ehrlichii TaxID=351052 RepID=UPI003B9EB8AB
MKSYFSSIFGRSPVSPLQHHMAKVLDCVEALVPLFKAVSEGDYNAVASAQQRITDLEREADALKKELRNKLPHSMFMPFDRADFLELLRAQDRIANKAKDIAGLVLGRKMQLPEPLVDPFMDFLNRAIDASRQAKNTVDQLDELVETGFRGAEVEVVQEMLDKLDAIEHDTDRMQVQLRSLLQKLEPRIPPVDVMFLYQLIERVGTLADRAQQTGSRLQILMAR